MHKILLFGAGVGSREVLRIIQALNKETPTWDVLGFVDGDASKIGKDIDEYPVYGLDYNVTSKDVYAVCGIMEPKLRRKVVENEIESRGFKLASIIHPSVFQPEDFCAGPGSIVYAGVNISFNVKLGKSAFVFFNVLLGHNLSAGDYVTICPSATIDGGCTIGAECFISAGVTLHPTISVGKESIVGIGTTLIRSIGDRKSVVSLSREIVREIGK